MLSGRWVGFCSLACAAVSVSAPVLAQPEGTSRAAARSLGYSGVKDYQNGDYPAALDKLERAYAVLRAPALALWSARAMVKMGKLVEGAERYLEATRLDVTTGDVQVQQKAQAEALQEHEQLVPRIPTLVVTVEGADPSEVRLVLDGKALASALLGQSLQVNPGNHSVEALHGEERRIESASVAEGTSQSLTLKFELTAPTNAPEASPPPAAPAIESTSRDTSPKAGSAQRTAGWVTLGVGGAGLVVGGVTALLALQKKSDLEGSCTDGRCSPAVRDEVDSYGTLRTVSTIGTIAGGVGVAAGLTLLFTAGPKSEPAPASGAVRLRGWVGLNQAGLTGEF
jgi:hypothetical protein